MSRRRGDEGSVLVIALVAVLVLGLMTAALARYAGAAFVNTRVADEQAQRRALAGAALRVAIDELASHRTLCTSTAAATGAVEIRMPAELGGATVTCALDSPEATPPLAGWGAVVTGIGAGNSALRAGSGTTKRVEGPLFLERPWSTSLSTPVVVSGGDLWLKDSDCGDGAPAVSGNLVVAPGEPRGIRCTTLSWESLFTVPTVPTAPALAPAPIDVDGCTVYQPGTYGSLTLTTDSYLVSGEYHLTGALTVKAVLVGGRPDPALGASPMLASAGACDGIVGKVAALEQGAPGVTLVVSGGGRLLVTSTGRLELFGRPQGAAAQPTALVAYRSDDPRGSYPPSVLAAFDSPVLNSDGGSTSAVVVHGLVWAPVGAVRVGNTAPIDGGMLRGPVVAGRLNLRSGFGAAPVLGVAPVPARAQVTVRAEVPGGGTGRTVAATAVVELEPATGALAVRSWTVR